MDFLESTTSSNPTHGMLLSSFHVRNPGKWNRERTVVSGSMA